VPLWGRAGPSCNNMTWAEVYLRIDPSSRLATSSQNRHRLSRKLGAVPHLLIFVLAGDLGPHLSSNPIQCGQAEAYTSMPSFNLIHPTVSPQIHNTSTLQTDRLTDRQTDRTDRQRSDSIRRTVLQKVAQNGSWATVCKTVRPMLYISDRCLSCLMLSVLSVCDLYCGKTVGWIKVPVGTEVGLSPGHTLLDGDPAPSKRVTSPNFRPKSVVAKRLDGIELGLGPGNIVLWGPSLPLTGAQPPIFGRCQL